MTEQKEILNDPNYIPIFDHGFVGLVDKLGDDSTPPQRARMSYGKGTKTINDDRSLLRYLIRHRHNTPVEMVELVFHIKLPIFVMRQHVRHRTASINEYSARYSEMSNEFYIPLCEDISLQSTTNKQGREEGDTDLMELEDKIEAQNMMARSYEQSFKSYEDLLALGVTRELARTVLPVANYTECFWKVNLHNFFHYSKLRRDSHAQKEIREFADAMFLLVEKEFPLCCEAFNDYIYEAVTFSRMEMKFLNHLLDSGINDGTLMALQAYSGGGNPVYDEIAKKLCEDYELTKRELDEFIKKITPPRLQ